MPRSKNNPETQKTFSRALNALMTLRKIKDAATLGRLAGIDEAAISRYINGKAMPNAESLLALSKALGVQMEELLTGITPAAVDTVQESIENRLSDLEKCDRLIGLEVGGRFRDAEKRFLLMEQRLNNFADALMLVYGSMRRLAALCGNKSLLQDTDKHIQELRMIIGGKGG